MKLRYVVITSVNRDDLPDGGSHHFAETVREVRRALPEARVEVLTPDFCGDLDAVARVLDAGPHVFNHNMETVPRLYRARAPAGGLPAVARRAGLRAPACGRIVLTKSGFMVGLGETADEVHDAAARSARGGHATSPPSASICSPRAAICRWPNSSSPRSSTPIATTGSRIGFKMVFSGPLVRSSYMADLVSERSAARRALC